MAFSCSDGSDGRLARRVSVRARSVLVSRALGLALLWRRVLKEVQRLAAFEEALGVWDLEGGMVAGFDGRMGNSLVACMG